MHDKRVNRTTDGNGYVSEMTLEEVRKLTIREQERIPTIEELLSLVNGQVGLILEIISQGIGVQLVSATQELGFTKPIIYASFLHAELLEVRSVAPNVTTMALLEGVPVTATSFAEDARAISVGVAVESLTAAFVHSLRSAGLSIFVYTVNDPLDIEWVKSLGVDGIISDFPDRI
jgi:glycerophosphoryl diester phosphodiesterase